MTILQRFGYYLGGFSIGLVILAFFLNGKNASCDYSPNARTIKSITSKNYEFTTSSLRQLNDLELDSLDVVQLIKKGSVNFSDSAIDSEKPCNTYLIESQKKPNNYVLKVENCDSIATLKTITYKALN